MELKLKYLLGYIFLLFLVISCALQNKTTQKKKLKFRKNYYTIEIPNEPLKKEDIIISGFTGKEYRYIFQDSSIIYCTDNNYSSSLISRFLKPSDYNRFLSENDTLSLSFLENNKYYVLHKLGYIFIGYVGVSQKDKEKFELAINSFKKKNK